MDANFLPSYLPSIRDQWVYNNGAWSGQNNSCVAQSIAVMLDIFENRQFGVTATNPSINYIYGNRTLQSWMSTEADGMYFGYTLDQVVISGSPRSYQIPEDNTSDKWYPSNRYLTDYYDGVTETGAATLYGDNQPLFKYSAINYKLSSNSYVDFFSMQETIAQAIVDNGAVFIGFEVANNMDSDSWGVDKGGTGIVPSPDYSLNYNHSFAIIGWKTIDSVKYWIVQNSWGDYWGWGDGGRAYLPMDYSYVLECFTAVAFDEPMPSSPDAPIFDTIPRVDRGFNLKSTYVDYANTYLLRSIPTSGGSYIYAGNNDIHPTFTPRYLDYGTEYYVSAKGVNGKVTTLASGNWSSNSIATTAPKLATASSTPHETSIDLNFSGFSGNWSRVLVEWSEDYSYSNSWSVYNPNISTTIIGLNAETTYHFRITVILYKNGTDLYSKDSNGDTSYYTFDVTTSSSGGTRPSNFSWTSSVVQGGSLSINFTTMKVIILTAVEWNSFTDRINSFRTYQGLSTYNFTTAVSGNPSTASMFNEVRAKIGDMSPPTSLPATTSASSSITASQINGLMNSLNSIT